MRNFNEFSALFRAPLFSKDFYRDVAANWRGIGLRHLMLMLFITWAIALTHYTIVLSRAIDKDIRPMFKDFPPITIKAGKASSPVAQPYFFKDDHGKPIFVLDTTGATKRPSDVGATFMCTETEWIQEQGGRLETRPLAAIPDGTYDGNTILSIMTMMRNLLLPIGLPLLWATWVAYRLVAALAFAGIGMAIAMGFGARLSFAAMMRLAIVAMTFDALYFDIGLSFMPFSLGCITWLLGHAITLGYLAYGIKVSADMNYEAFPVEVTPSTSNLPQSPFP